MLKLVAIQIVDTTLTDSFLFFSNPLRYVEIKQKYSWSYLSLLSTHIAIYFFCRAIPIYDLPINPQYIYKRVSPL